MDGGQERDESLEVGGRVGVEERGGSMGVRERGGREGGWVGGWE